MKKTIVIKNNFGQRIDKFLMKEFFLNSDITRGEIIRNIKSKGVLVNNKAVKPSYLLKENDEIKINIIKNKKGLATNKNVKFKVISENKDFIVINKPAGLQVLHGKVRPSILPVLD